MANLTTEKTALFEPTEMAQRLGALRRQDKIKWLTCVLELLWLEFPAFAKPLKRCQDEVTRTAERTEAMLENAVLAAIERGHWPRKDIVAKVSQTLGVEIADITVYRKLIELWRAGRIKRVLGDHSGTGSGGDRKSYLYLPLEKTTRKK